MNKILAVVVLFFVMCTPSFGATTFRLHANKSAKTSLADGDIFLIEDSAASWATKYTSMANIQTKLDAHFAKGLAGAGLSGHAVIFGADGYVIADGGAIVNITLGTGVQTALAINVGTTGGFVTDTSTNTLTNKSIPVATKSTATTYTIGTTAANEAYGGVVYVTAAATVTAPAVVAGMNFTVVTIGDIAVSLDVNAADKMILDGVTLSDGDKATNSSKAGDTITCTYYSADGFYCWSGTVLGGHWTDGN